MAAANLVEVPGTFEILPVPPVVNCDGVQSAPERIVNHQDIDIYAHDAPFPPSLLGPISTGRLRQWQLVDVPIALYQYLPITNRLYQVRDATLTVAFRRLADVRSTLGAGSDDPIGQNRVKRLAVNFEAMASAYQALAPRAPLSQARASYVSMTTRAIQTNSHELQAFVHGKQQRGWTVEVITEEIWGGGIGDTAAENIRRWLQANYLSRQIEYVLLIGNPDPFHGDVPMKMLWPRHNDADYQESPSDYYYADLTGHWDLDGDGFYGEWPDDFGPGGMDRNWDVLVGRIPFYGQWEDLDHILAKSFAYEQATPAEAAWRANVLLPMEPSDASTPGYHLGEAIKDSVIVPKGEWGYHRIYDADYGLTPPPETVPTTVDTVTQAWNSAPFGGIFWWTHGWSEGAVDVMDLAHAATLDDTHPGFTFQASCDNAFPEDPSNLAYALLRHGAGGTQGATRVSWYYPGQQSFAGTNSNSGMTYEYAKRVIADEMESGLALYDLKQVLTPTGSALWMNFTVFNLYGDPALGLFTVSTPVPPVISCQGGRSHIRGRVISTDDAVGLPGVTLTLHGPDSCQETTTTKALGLYLFPHLKDGTYTVTPSDAACIYDPPGWTVTLEGGHARLNFEATCP